MTTRAAFLTAYRAKVAAYPWAADTDKLDRFMKAVEETLTTKNTTWVWNEKSSRAVWREIGCKHKMTLTALRALDGGN